MYSYLRRFRAVTLLLAVVVALPASAATYSFGSNLGYVSYYLSVSHHRCIASNGSIITYTDYNSNSFAYVSNQGVTQAIGGTTYFSLGGRANDPQCPPDPHGPQISFNGNGYSITISPATGGIHATISVPGYINPKYVVLGVEYAPPGPQSFVDYTSSAMVSNTSSVSSSFSSAYTVSTKISTSGLFGFLNGTTTGSSSSTFTQGSTRSSSTTVSKMSSVSVKVPGPTNPYIGVDHDYDVIWVWLNPVALFTLGHGTVEWNGYGYSKLDQNAMDVIAVYPGCLNGDFDQTYCNNQYQTSFARSWAAGEVWPSGQGPGLTAADLQNILATDPYGRCNSTSPIGSSVCPSPDPTRFTQTLNSNVVNQQAPPGGQPVTTAYTNFYTSTSSQGQTASYTFSQAFGLEQTFNISSIFGIGFNGTTSTTLTLTWTNQWNSQFTSGTGESSNLSISEPPCNVVGGNCSPAYPPTSPTYGQANEFDVYQDNLYGTFLLIPIRY